MAISIEALNCSAIVGSQSFETAVDEVVAS